ncbi:imidazole glycerol phosphate synthase subunit HisH [Chamaesiphon minutus]|uniref:Imidazole glycerol phosphate synthase subunit HisH n=1 Tax=Chamaesiphon minutus (strain ATCC 27169 / PCC 6605) TaxID=1173020 RepID=K9UL72_CHAP6|nr:imidazole glycerol phosphate synthase subunit HisH [Chamaesiphon minutus]AFY95580.1 imidazole glycerol phosphate synthase, glutamine amidotransferase subunit [Chamaesiphon minutus PCC 6605]
MLKIAVVDYDMGNLHSVCKGLQHAGADTVITHEAAELAAADAIVLPGVGSFDPAMNKIRDRDLEQPLKDIIATGKPFLGICLGLQILFERSDEGKEAGLGIIPGTVRKFQPEPNLTIPQMGWNQIHLTQPNCPLWGEIDTNAWVYFDHSYYVDPSSSPVAAATVTHGTQTVTAAIARDNVMAVQFHPEKSATIGLQMLANFVQMVDRAS